MPWYFYLIGAVTLLAGCFLKIWVLIVMTGIAPIFGWCLWRADVRGSGVGAGIAAFGQAAMVLFIIAGVALLWFGALLRCIIGPLGLGAWLTSLDFGSIGTWLKDVFLR